MAAEQNKAPETKEERKARRAQERAFKKKVLLIVSIIVMCLAAILIIVLIVLFRGHLKAEQNTVATATVEDFEMSYAGEKTTFASSSSAEETAEETDPNEPAPLPNVSLQGLNSTSAIMMRLSDGAIVSEYNSEAQIYPASMTKMLTTITAIENISDLDDTYTFDGSEFDRAYMNDATTAGFSAGESVPYKDILYGIMLPSGADACYAIASALGGSEELFVQMMNAEAQKIGMTNSNFTNSVGLQDENLYTTCADMAKLLEYCLQNETFRSIFTTRIYTTSKTTQHATGIALGSTTFTHIESTDLSNGCVILGGKTGFTDEAGHCLASLARAEDGTEYILVTAGAPGDAQTYTNLQDAVTVYSQLPGSGLGYGQDEDFTGELDFGEKVIDTGVQSTPEAAEQPAAENESTESEETYYYDDTYDTGYSDDTYYEDTTYSEDTYYEDEYYEDEY